MCLSSGQRVEAAWLRLRGGLTEPHEGAHKAPMKNRHLLAFLPASVSDQVQRSAVEYRGYAPIVADGLGALVFGQLYGWRGVMMLYSRSRIRDFEKALGITFRDHMPERTELSARITGVRVADEIGKFWAVVKGEVPVQGGKAYVDDVGQDDMFRTG